MRYICIMFLYKTSEVNICVLLREHPNVRFAENDAGAYTPCLGPHRKLILTAVLPKFSQSSVKIMYIPKIDIFIKKYP